VSGHDIAVILNFKTCQCGSKTNWVIPKLGISEAKQTRFSLKLGKIEARRTSSIVMWHLKNWKNELFFKRMLKNKKVR
jgi:hypothetical protein